MSHPLFILVFMWSWRQRETITPAKTVPSGGPECCRAGADGLVHCHGTLVLHADGVLDCDECVYGTDPSLHEWWVPCIELETPCGCVGDEHPAGLAAEAA